MSFGTEIGLGPGHIVLDGYLAPPKGHRSPSPIFGPCLLWPNGWMDQDVTCYGDIGLGPGDIVLDGDPAPSPPPEGAQQIPTFGHVYCGQTVALSATAELLLINC